MAQIKALRDCKSSQDHYIADGGWAVFCSDDRFTTAHLTARQELGEHIDAFKVLGGIKHLASPKREGDREFALDQLAISIALHHTKKAILIAHLDCGAYKAEVLGMNRDAESGFYLQELRKAKKAVLNRFPEIGVRTLFVDFDRICEAEV
jgi:carbonic anhydrase